MSDPITRLNAALEGRYRIESELGEGGMATVYLADDLKHERKVALKVLKPELAAVVGAERFLAEIKTTANLQHPHILPLHDSGEADGFLFYVMPYVEGESLRERLNREHQLPVDDAVRITTDIAEALDHAHRQGVVHRDIKPANILLRDGRPLVADFGIALAVNAAGGGRLTETGLSMGTPYYMSPEQASADREPTATSDVYSLACVLYEMLSGEPPHTGSSAQAVLAKILTADVATPRDVRPSIPVNVDAAIRTGLQRLAADRFTSAIAFAGALRDPGFSAAPSGTAATPGSTHPTRRLTGALASISVILLMTTIWALGTRGSGMSGGYDVGLPVDAPMLMNVWRGFALSPTGDFVVYTSGLDSASTLWYRNLRTDEARLIPGTEGASQPTISPDGTRVAFARAGRFQAVSVSGGDVATITELRGDAAGVASTWLSDSRLLLGDLDGNRQRWIDPTGGREVDASSGSQCGLPKPLPDNRILCGGIEPKYAFVQGPDDRSRQFVRSTSALGAGLLRGSDFHLVDDEYLVYTAVDGDVRAVPFDPESMEVGRSVSVLSGVRREPFSGLGQYAISANGTLVYAPGKNAGIGRFVSNDGEGPVPLPMDVGQFKRYALSPDGRRLAAVAEGLVEDELHVFELDGGTSNQWLSGFEIGESLWTPDGDSLVTVLSDTAGNSAVVIGSPTSRSPPDTLLAGTKFGPFSYSGDHIIGHISLRDVAAIDRSVSPPAVDTLVTGAYFGVLSDDARWIAYHPAGEGRVMVIDFPTLADRRPVADGWEPQWLGTNELAFWRRGGRFHRVGVAQAGQLDIGVPHSWFTDPLFVDTPGRSYTISAEGAAVYLQGPERRSASYIRVVPNWVEQMKRVVDEANR